MTLRRDWQVLYRTALWSAMPTAGSDLTFWSLLRSLLTGCGVFVSKTASRQFSGSFFVLIVVVVAQPVRMTMFYLLYYLPPAAR